MYNSSKTNKVLKGIATRDLLEIQSETVEGDWVSECLQQQMKYWNGFAFRFLPNHADPIMITAPTGTGKTSFVLEKLAAIAKSRNRSVLLFVNREVLGQQILSDRFYGIAGYKLSPEVLRRIKQAGNNIVMSYQQLAINNKKISKLARSLEDQNVQYIVMDEAHFFASDALFNTWTCQILRNIIQLSYKLEGEYNSVQRIYMSATLDDVREIIAYEEKRYNDILMKNYLIGDASQDQKDKKGLRNDYAQCSVTDKTIAMPKYHCWNEVETFQKSLPQKIKEYIVPPRPCNLNMHFFFQWDTILNEIDRSEEKWLIFVASEEEGKLLKTKLGGIADFVCADKESAAVEYLETTSKVRRKILISTSTLDNGVSIKDEKLKNIVIDSVDPVEIVQMFGRKRREDGETIQLYIRNKSVDDFSTYCKSVKNRAHAIDRCEKSPQAFWETSFNKSDYETRKMFSISNGRLYVNPYARYLLAKKGSMFIELQDKLNEDPDAFAISMCELFDIAFCKNMILSDDPFNDMTEEVREILGRYMEGSFDKNGLIKLHEEIMETFPERTRGTGLTRADSSKVTKATINKNLEIIFENADTYYIIKQKEKQYYIEEVQR